ncbi:hypothetical protein AB1A62_14430 [Leisingera sp. JC11]
MSGIQRPSLQVASKTELVNHFQRPVVIAVTIMRMMQPAIDQVTNVTAMRDSLMPAPGAMHMAFFVAKVISGNRRAGVGVCVRDFNLVFVHMIFMRVMEVAVVDVVDVVAVTNGRMAASGPMFMGVVLVLRIIACGH